jgi:hypothetical protein
MDSIRLTRISFFFAVANGFSAIREVMRTLSHLCAGVKSNPTVMSYSELVLGSATRMSFFKNPDGPSLSSSHR